MNFLEIAQTRQSCRAYDESRPVEPEKLNLIAVNCPNCGSSFQAAKGYASKCPYCGGYINA